MSASDKALINENDNWIDTMSKIKEKKQYAEELWEKSSLEDHRARTRLHVWDQWPLHCVLLLLLPAYASRYWMNPVFYQITNLWSFLSMTETLNW